MTLLLLKEKKEKKKKMTLVFDRNTFSLVVSYTHLSIELLCQCQINSHQVIFYIFFIQDKNFTIT